MDWITDRFNRLLHLGVEDQQLDSASEQDSPTFSSPSIAWRRLGDTLCGDAARFSARSRRALGATINAEQICLYWPKDMATLLLIYRNLEDEVFTYSAPQQEPNNVLQHGGTIVPISPTAYKVRDCLSATKIMSLEQLSQLLLGPLLFGDLPIIG